MSIIYPQHHYLHYRKQVKSQQQNGSTEHAGTNNLDQQQNTNDQKREGVHGSFGIGRREPTTCSSKVCAAVLHVNIVSVNATQLHAPHAGDLPSELHTVARLAGLLYDGHDLHQALRGDAHVGTFVMQRRKTDCGFIS